MPREVLPGRFYMITRRCTQRTFLLRPDAETNNAFAYCLAVAAARFEIVVLGACAMSNHHHTLVFDRHGNYPEFIEHFHKLMARSQNALRGRWENFWSSGPASVVRLVDLDDVIRKLVYVLTNPVKDHLVERVHHWPGVNTYRALRTNRVIEARRPAHFFRPNGSMPETATLRVAFPPELGPANEILRQVVDGISEAERRAAEERRVAGSSIVGRARVLRQSWRDCPDSEERRRGLQPRIAAQSVWSRIEALQRNQEFVRAYRTARRAWLGGEAAAFPSGTYWLRRFARVPIGESSQPPTPDGSDNGQSSSGSTSVPTGSSYPTSASA